MRYNFLGIYCHFDSKSRAALICRTCDLSPHTFKNEAAVLLSSCTDIRCKMGVSWWADIFYGCELPQIPERFKKVHHSIREDIEDKVQITIDSVIYALFRIVTYRGDSSDYLALASSHAEARGDDESRTVPLPTAEEVTKFTTLMLEINEELSSNVVPKMTVICHS